jgi:hypothetical protein
MINLTGQKDGMEQIQTGMVNYLWKGNRGIEADNELGLFNNSISNPTITNITVGPGSAPTTGTWLENQAIKLRRGTKAILQTY